MSRVASGEVADDAPGKHPTAVFTYSSSSLEAPACSFRWTSFLEIKARAEVTSGGYFWPQLKSPSANLSPSCCTGPVPKSNSSNTRGIIAQEMTPINQNDLIDASVKCALCQHARNVMVQVLALKEIERRKSTNFGLGTLGVTVPQSLFPHR